MKLKLEKETVRMTANGVPIGHVIVLDDSAYIRVKYDLKIHDGYKPGYKGVLFTCIASEDSPENIGESSYWPDDTNRFTYMGRLICY